MNFLQHPDPINYRTNPQDGNAVAEFSRVTPPQQELCKGLCVNCDNRLHCMWREDNKITCEHFE